MHRAVWMMLVLALAGCRTSQAPAKASQPPAFQAPPPAAVATAPEDAPRNVVEGKVLERLDAAPYSYLHLRTEGGDRWAAVPLTDLKPGARAKVVDAFQMDGFESKKLKRTFDRVWLGHLEGGPASTSASPHGGALPAPEADLANIQVEKAAGPDARTVAGIFAQKDALQGKTVVVRAKVVKFLAGIMNKNWAHLRDGSGSAKNLDDDLAVTTQADLKVGSVMTLKGTLGRKRDFGSGYYYEVLLEDAVVEK